jgi:2-aminoadipate transaminase
VRRGLRARRDAMLRALEREFPEGARWNVPAGGYFLWLELPRGIDAESLLDRATEAGVTFVKGADFYSGTGGEGAARLAFSFASVKEIEEGVATLGRLVRAAAAVAV